MDLPAPGLGRGREGTCPGGSGSHQAPPQFCVTVRGCGWGGFVPTCPHCHLPKAHHLFELLKLQRIFVTRFGELVGAVSRVEVRGGDKGVTMEGGDGDKEGTGPQPTSSVPLQLRRAIEELANPK